MQPVRHQGYSSCKDHAVYIQQAVEEEKTPRWGSLWKESERGATVSCLSEQIDSLMQYNLALLSGRLFSWNMYG